MPEKIPFHCPEFWCRKKFTSDRWQLEHIKFHHLNQLQDSRQKKLTIRSVPKRVELTQRCEFNANKDSVEDFDTFPCLEYIDNIADLE